MKCTTCGTDLPNDVAFCPNCGARVPAASSAGSPTILIGANEQPAPAPKSESGSSTGKLLDLPANPYDAPQSYNPPAAPAQYYTPQGNTVPQGSVPQHYAAPALPNSTAAVVSLIAGILSWTILPIFVTGIVAIVAGHMAKNEIRRANGELGGNGLATAGLILGYAHIAVALLIICAIIGIGFLTLLGTRVS